MSSHESEMYTGEKIFLDILVFGVASAYWFFSGHMVAAILGYVFVSVFIYNDDLYFTSLILAIITILTIIFFFYHDYYFYKEGDELIGTGMGVIYMLIILLKSKSIFDAD